MGTPERRVSSWNELNDALFENSFNPELHRFRSNFAFRGVGDARQNLRTSLMHLGGSYVRLEQPILRSFRKYAHRAAAQGNSVWNWLSLAQHHGLPTRLLDWTYSPFVAMHFATVDAAQMDVDGVVWCMDFTRVREHLPATLRQRLEEEFAQAFTVEMLESAARTLAEFDALSPEPFVLFLEPPSLDDRVVHQYALFSIMSSAERQLDEWLENRPDLCLRVIIPARLKWEVRDKLDQANINERTLFPGLDGLSLWLKRFYSPGPRLRD